MGKYCKPGEKKGMHLVEFLVLLEKYQVFCDSFRVRDVKDPFLACKLMVLDEMTTVATRSFTSLISWRSSYACTCAIRLGLLRWMKLSAVYTSCW
ncbi:hypothetical protein GQ600_12493 [Phytophthora cactorum]|nr:hypothetical protein GQ600_12493 [Phytophthora cactorum]